MIQPQNRHLRKSDYPIILLHKLGIFNGARWLTPRHLTVLNYHRIDDVNRSGFDTFRPNVSASQAEFARQMDFLARNYRIISVADIVAFIKTDRALPPRAALITFDDGYIDNYTNAYPILKSRGLPAIIFLTTGYIESDRPFYWDLAAYCFYHTKKEAAELPCVGTQFWSNETTRDRVMYRWIEAIKMLPEGEKQLAVTRLPEILGVNIPGRAFANTMISWTHAREMSDNGIEMGGHTVNHPILTRISLGEAISEIVKSKQRIEDELRKPVSTFAYPNGQLADFNMEIAQQVKQAGYESAFSLLSGPTRYATVARQPFAIRRIFLSHEDNFSRFVAKLTGVPRMISRW